MTAKQVKDSLIAQLQAKGADIALNQSLIDDYMFYWNFERKMQRDVKKRGCTYESTSAAGKTFEKENPSVKGAMLYNKQKLAILKELGITADKVILDNDDDDNLL